jgi:hypothetical protein
MLVPKILVIPKKDAFIRILTVVMEISVLMIGAIRNLDANIKLLSVMITALVPRILV